MMKNNRVLLTLKYTFFMSVVLVASLIIIYIVSDRARHESFQGTLRSEAITKANLFLENKVDVTTMQHIYLNNTQFINEVEVAVYTPDFKMLYHDAAEHDIVKETHEMIRQICEKGEMSLPAPKGYQAVGILYSPPFKGGVGGGFFVVTAAAHDGYGEANMVTLRNTLLSILLTSILLMLVAGYALATLTIRPIERALTAQKMFASNVSHELRTPLAAIMGELGLALQKERTPEDYQGRISRALDDASRMSDTIIGLLNLARAEYDASQIKMEPIRVDELLMDVIEEMLRAKPEYHINLSFEVPLDPLLSPLKGDDSVRISKSPFKGDLEGPSVIANRYLLALAFRNLIENNCKYSPDHTSHVAIGVLRGLSITFADNGIGMTPAEHRNLFRMFYRGSNHAEGGHGIGMALVQRIMVLHNACIDIQSKEGHGTKFVISFPSNK